MAKAESNVKVKENVHEIWKKERKKWQRRQATAVKQTKRWQIEK